MEEGTADEWEAFWKETVVLRASAFPLLFSMGGDDIPEPGAEQTLRKLSSLSQETFRGLTSAQLTSLVSTFGVLSALESWWASNADSTQFAMALADACVVGVDLSLLALEANVASFNVEEGSVLRDALLRAVESISREGGSASDLSEALEALQACELDSVAMQLGPLPGPLPSDNPPGVRALAGGGSGVSGIGGSGPQGIHCVLDRLLAPAVQQPG
eukprot:CAMPEP_0117676922 /NCGR_PEP_ID=MMETSP0804-20121206/16469_1 /TAXON_ID=1074897 /ORGANISM="Tetraselmis astigmatica, Strain CCMP880" /LENGTH=215 /DNA_ID=CAMNT_0005486169 /DNA_START=444 /DNA_END=1087 /DNA_ORIENTATION=+